MPKEIIARRPPNHAIELRWSKDHAEIGVNHNREFSFTDEGFIYTALFFTFSDRDEINRMIRTLRKMRNTVFGKDA